ncbi:hypothetical protein HK097_007658 [Rhizophlyctis rosea]|uniref:Uncharacterized protein n=1 Tax=Rhizophlyctis rosea TaxID=64517 RepID=A0AAD5X4F3_9FUNG|nr:hypothetical protein HK097_007658 [Rhizophlyctis rosea]
MINKVPGVNRIEQQHYLSGILQRCLRVKGQKKKSKAEILTEQQYIMDGLAAGTITPAEYAAYRAASSNSVTQTTGNPFANADPSTLPTPLLLTGSDPTTQSTTDSNSDSDSEHEKERKRKNEEEKARRKAERKAAKAATTVQNPPAPIIPFIPTAPVAAVPAIPTPANPTPAITISVATVPVLPPATPAPVIPQTKKRKSVANDEASDEVRAAMEEMREAKEVEKGGPSKSKKAKVEKEKEKKGRGKKDDFKSPETIKDSDEEADA